MSMIEALLEERRGYVVRGLNDRVAQVDAEIERLSGAKVAADPTPELDVEEATDPTAVETTAGRGRKRP
jgi:hypothetical protein